MIAPVLLFPLLLSLLNCRQQCVHQPQHAEKPHLEFAGVFSDECCCRRVPCLCGKLLIVFWCAWAGWAAINRGLFEPHPL